MGSPWRPTTLPACSPARPPACLPTSPDLHRLAQLQALQISPCPHRWLAAPRWQSPLRRQQAPERRQQHPALRDVGKAECRGEGGGSRAGIVRFMPASSQQAVGKQGMQCPCAIAPPPPPPPMHLCASSRWALPPCICKTCTRTSMPVALASRRNSVCMNVRHGDGCGALHRPGRPVGAG